MTDSAKIHTFISHFIVFNEMYCVIFDFPLNLIIASSTKISLRGQYNESNFRRSKIGQTQASLSNPGCPCGIMVSLSTKCKNDLISINLFHDIIDTIGA